MHAVNMSRQQLEALGYTLAESDLPPIVCEWRVGDAVLCATLGEFDYSDNEAWKKLKPHPVEPVLAGIRFLVVSWLSRTRVDNQLRTI